MVVYALKTSVHFVVRYLCWIVKHLLSLSTPFSNEERWHFYNDAEYFTRYCIHYMALGAAYVTVTALDTPLHKCLRCHQAQAEGSAIFLPADQVRTQAENVQRHLVAVLNTAVGPPVYRRSSLQWSSGVRTGSSCC